MKAAFLPALAAFLTAWSAGAGESKSDGKSKSKGEDLVTVLPGASQKISHSLSASRDTALLAYQLTPYSILTAGATSPSLR